MIREDVIDSAVTFLQDPSVASAPLEQRTAFLRSKNLTQEEIDASLARAGGQSSTSHASPPPSQYSPQYRQTPQQYGGYGQQPYWEQPPPEPPRRDWRDWFIMATVVGGVGYGMYWTAKRYVYPLIAPPTPPQLEQDKASIDASFDKAFALLDQLATDTQELKASEKARTERLDQALSEVESVVGRMKEANENREMEAKRMARELADIREQIPRAIEKEKETTDERLKDLAGEMKSLKTLVASRMGGPQRPTPSYASSQPPAPVNPVAGGPSPVQVPEVNGTNAISEENERRASTLPDRSANASPYGRVLGGSNPQIPTWQLEAKKRSEAKKRGEEAKKDEGASGGLLGMSTSQDTSDSETISEAGRAA